MLTPTSVLRTKLSLTFPQEWGNSKLKIVLVVFYSFGPTNQILSFSHISTGWSLWPAMSYQEKLKYFFDKVTWRVSYVLIGGMRHLSLVKCVLKMSPFLLWLLLSLWWASHRIHLSLPSFTTIYNWPPAIPPLLLQYSAPVQMVATGHDTTTEPPSTSIGRKRIQCSNGAAEYHYDPCSKYARPVCRAVSPIHCWKVVTGVRGYREAGPNCIQELHIQRGCSSSPQNFGINQMRCWICIIAPGSVVVLLPCEHHLSLCTDTTFTSSFTFQIHQSNNNYILFILCFAVTEK